MEKYKLEIKQDVIFESPRNWEKLTNILCFHKRYNLFDKHYYKSEDYNSWEDFKKVLVKHFDPYLILPLYMYDHSGFCFDTKPFGCKFDSGQIGFVIVTKESYRECFDKKRISYKNQDVVLDIIKSEIQEYQYYVNCECYEYVISKTDTNEIIESVGGYLGYKNCQTEGEKVLEYYNKR